MAKKKGYKPSIPQNLMREDMVRESQSLAQVFEGMGFPEEQKSSGELTAYGRFDQKVPSSVHDIINQYELVLSLAQWQTVQAMMEQAMRVGYAHGEQAQA